MNGIKLLGAGHALPETIVTNDDLSKIVETDDQWISSRTGIRSRRRCVGETHTSLCAQAARQAMDMAGVAPEEIGAVIVATVSPDFLTPSAACLVQRELGLLEDTICFDLNAACSGFLYGLHTMECLLTASPRKFGLVIGGEVLSRLTDYTDRGTCILFGDGAGAAVVESRPSFPSICAQLGVRGEERVLRVAGPGTGEDQKIRMEGSAVFKFAVETVPRCLEQVLQAAHMTADDVDLFVLHQANQRILDAVARRCHLPPEKCAQNIDKYGNISAASIPILLSELCQNGRLRPGTRALCVGFGGGLTWGGALIEMGVKE
jgi:3-oxoacyl-[acyl-carrier-protein] synthase-3